MKKILLITGMLLVLASCSTSNNVIDVEEKENKKEIEKELKHKDCRDTNCANYTSQAEAQRAYDADPECRNDLDRDKDGVACEEPGNSVKDCGSTSQSGCSGKRKASCQNDSCCRWVVGSGCKGR